MLNTLMDINTTTQTLLSKQPVSTECVERVDGALRVKSQHEQRLYDTQVDNYNQTP
jgi:hypothetical protein